MLHIDFVGVFGASAGIASERSHFLLGLVILKYRQFRTTAKQGLTCCNLVNFLIQPLDFQAAYYGRTALIEAARNGYVEIVELLLNKGADANLCDKTGRNTALIEAIKHRHENVIRLLLASRKVDFSDKDIRLSTLVWAGGACSPEIRSALDVEIQNFFEANKNTSARVN